jgi:hypothetical protein
MRTAVLLVFILGMPPAVGGGELRKVTVYDGHVTFGIPADWREIPPEVLESHSLQMAEASGGRLTEIYQHGFHSSDAEIDFLLPECLIQIRESGRLRYRQFLRLPDVATIRSDEEETLAERVGAAVRGMEPQKAVFDRQRFVIHLSSILDLGYEVEASVESFAFLTERGLFTIHFYVPVRRAPAMAPIYSRIIDSVRLDDELRYRPRLADRWPPRPATLLLAAAALLAALAVAVHLFQRRRGQS